ncbi:MAG TPA: protein kinase [Planctomycetota bacterium]
MADTPDRSQAEADSQLARKVLKDGLLTPEQLRDVLIEQDREKARGQGRPLAALLAAKGYLPRPKTLKEPTAFGKYQLLRELGRGGMGVVYEAKDVALGRGAAIKMMIPTASATPEEARGEEERFLREGRLAASLPKHPHIVGVYEAGVIDGRRYIAMELIQGTPLSEWRETEAATPRKEVELLRDAALAAHHAHERGIIHRDLKPPNILVDAQGAPHITDFGLAKIVGKNLSVSLTGAGMVVGTPAYISPEQAQGLKSTDRRTDVYALGVLLFETLTGRQPFQGETAMEILMKASKNPVPLPSSLLKLRITPAQARGLEIICLKALQKNPKDRYPDAAAFAADLTRWLKGEEIKSLHKTRRLPRVRQVRHWGAAAGAVAALLAVGLYFLLSGKPAEVVDPALEARRARESREKEEALRKLEDELKAMKAQLQKAVVHPDPKSLRPGAVAEFFSGTNFDIPCVRRVDPGIAFRGKETWPDAQAEFVSMRWSGFIDVPESGPVSFQISCHDGTRFSVDGVEVFTHWARRPSATDTHVVLLEKGLHRVALEHFQINALAHLSFVWRRASDVWKPDVLHDPAKLPATFERKWAWEHFDFESLPGAQEAETLPILYAAPEATFVLPFGRKKGVLVWAKNTKVGDRLRLRFNAEKAVGTLGLGFWRTKNSATVSVAVNGKVVASSLDLFWPANHVVEAEFRNVELKIGPNELEFVIVGSNPAAVEWKKGDGILKMSLDYVRIR